MLNQVLGRERFELVQDNGAKVHERLKEGTNPALVFMKWEKGNHALVYVRSDDQYVYLKDPNGTPLIPKGDSAEVKPPREATGTEGGGNTKMRIADFEAHLLGACIERNGPPPPDPLKVAARTALALPRQAQAEAKKLAAAAPVIATGMVQEMQQEVQKVESALNAGANVVQNKVEATVNDAKRFGSLLLPQPPADPVQLFSQVFGPRK